MSSLIRRTFVIRDKKPPWDQYFVEVDVSKWLQNDSINSVSFTAKDSDGNDATNEVLDAAKNTWEATKIKPYIKGGEENKNYIVSCKAAADSGDQVEIYIKFDVGGL